MVGGRAGKRKIAAALDKYYDTIYAMESMPERTISSPLELAIAGLLWQQARSGYDLLKVFAETAMGGFSSSPGAVYPALKRLQKSGLIAGIVENRGTLRPRQVYHATAAGVDALKEYLRQPVTRDEVIRRPDGVLLRFVFAGEMLGCLEAIRILEDYARQCEAYVPELRVQLAALPQTAEYGRYALERGINSYVSDAHWARQVIRRLKHQAPRRSVERKSGTRRRDAAEDGGHRS